ncbi:hypothetical protein [Streptomyces huiliensis]|uniref:hypothetical protein n=1 Tax=Streptomyces huiliensis TaxID=2876027 RepID=UPI001CBB68F6|nr:hypothetical protein [Streptomyces huiliensis]MBZ4319913.1 hypothetical protein [Streptomyces huiliensis]
MGPLISITKLRFLLRDGIWRERRLSAPVCAVTGPIGSGTSTALECLFYVLGLGKGDVAEMPPMTACKELQLLCTISGVPWVITRAPASGNVVFREAHGEGIVKPFPLTSRNGTPCAGDFVLELLGIPHAQRSGARLGLPELMRAMYLQEGTISTHLFGGLSTEERKLVFDVLLGLRDEELTRLEDAYTQADRAHAAPSRLLSQLTKRRAERGLDHPDLVLAEQSRKQDELETARRTAQDHQEQLSDIAAQRGRLELAVGQARQQEKTARKAAEKAQEEAEQAATDRRGTRLPAWPQTPRRPAHPLQRVPAGTSRPARRTLLSVRAAHRRQRRQHAPKRVGRGAGPHRHGGPDGRPAARAPYPRGPAGPAGEEKTQQAQADLARHERDLWKPHQQRTLDAESRVNYLAGEIAQLQERLKEIQLLIDLTAQMEPLKQARAEAREALDAARRERDTRRKDRILLWSKHLLKHARAVLPDIDQAHIDPDNYTTVIGHKSFDICSVAGGERILHNVCALLALQDVAREVPDTLIPSLLIIDCPGYGSDTNDLDRDTATRLITQILGQAHDDHTQVLLAAQSLPAQNSAPGVRRIPLTHDTRFFDDAPHSTDHAA